MNDDDECEIAHRKISSSTLAQKFHEDQDLVQITHEIGKLISAGAIICPSRSFVFFNFAHRKQTIRHPNHVPFD